MPRPNLSPEHIYRKPRNHLSASGIPRQPIMQPSLPFLISFFTLFFASFSTTAVASITPEVQARVNVRIVSVKAIAADPLIVEAVAAQNAGLSAEQSAVKQELWSRYNKQQKLVQSLSTNTAAGLLQAKCGDWANEAFLSDSHGFKVAFLNKPTNWCHAGKPKNYFANPCLQNPSCNQNPVVHCVL